MNPATGFRMTGRALREFDYAVVAGGLADMAIACCSRRILI